MNQLLNRALLILGATTLVGLVGIIALALTNHTTPDALIAITSSGIGGVTALLVNSGNGGNTVGQAESVTVAQPQLDDGPKD